MVKDGFRFVLPAVALALACALAGWWVAASAFLAAADIVFWMAEGWMWFLGENCSGP